MKRIIVKLSKNYRGKYDAAMLILSELCEDKSNYGLIGRVRNQMSRYLNSTGRGGRLFTWNNEGPTKEGIKNFVNFIEKREFESKEFLKFRGNGKGIVEILRSLTDRMEETGV